MIDAIPQQRELWKANVRQFGHTGTAARDTVGSAAQTAAGTRTVVRSFWNLWGLLGR